MPVESTRGRGATRNATPTRFNLKERAVDGEWLDYFVLVARKTKPLPERLRTAFA